MSYVSTCSFKFIGLYLLPMTPLPDAGAALSSNTCMRQVNVNVFCQKTDYHPRLNYSMSLSVSAICKSNPLVFKNSERLLQYFCFTFLHKSVKLNMLQQIPKSKGNLPAYKTLVTENRRVFNMVTIHGVSVQSYSRLKVGRLRTRVRVTTRERGARREAPHSGLEPHQVSGA